jgi:miniconductance mechanosensitive channel
MRQPKKLKAWGLGIAIALTVLLFTNVFSQEQPSVPRTDGAVAVEMQTAGNPSAEQGSSASSRAGSDASLSPEKKQSSLSEFTAYVRESMQKHPVLTNLCLVGALLAIILVNLAIRQVFLYGLQLVFKKIPSQNGEYRKQLYATASRLAFIVPIVVVYMILEAVNINPENLVRTRKICMSLTLICAVAALVSLLNILDLWYRRHSNTHDHSIKGGIQLIQMFAVLVALIMVASILMNRSPVMLLSGLGAVAAVLILIFQDTILALVSGIQLSTNHMIQLGDWIELPSENVDGVIVDVALHTVKVQNWDMTIVTVPTRKLTVETFINWRGVYEAGGRRIKRSLNIDMRSIRFLDDDEIAELNEFVLLDDYLNRKQHEIEAWNHELEVNGVKPVNGRRITNIGTFRIYIEKYLRSLKTVNPKLMILVRQLQPSDTGLPIEVYCFANTTDWSEYERIQSDIFDHLLAILPVFGLRVFQKCSDIYQEPGGVQRKIGGIFPQDIYVAPDHPGTNRLRRGDG